jgi:hypothetical protein
MEWFGVLFFFVDEGVNGRDGEIGRGTGRPNQRWKIFRVRSKNIHMQIQRNNGRELIDSFFFYVLHAVQHQQHSLVERCHPNRCHHAHSDVISMAKLVHDVD